MYYERGDIINELKLIIGLNRAVNKINKLTSNLCAKHGLTLSQFAVLEVLYHKGNLTVGQVKDYILSSDGTIPVVIRNLEKRMLVKRTKHKEDNRSFLISITDKGIELIELVFPLNKKIIEEYLSVYSDEEKNLLLDLLKKLK